MYYFIIQDNSLVNCQCVRVHVCIFKETICVCELICVTCSQGNWTKELPIQVSLLLVVVFRGKWPLLYIIWTLSLHNDHLNLSYFLNTWVECETKTLFHVRTRQPDPSCKEWVRIRHWKMKSTNLAEAIRCIQFSFIGSVYHLI